MEKRPRPFTAEKRAAEFSGVSLGVTNDDLMNAFRDLEAHVREIAGRLEEIAAAPQEAPPPPPPPVESPSLVSEPSPEIEKIKHDVAALKAVNPENDKLVQARHELKTVTEITDKAANEIMNQSDEIQVVVDKIREEISAGNTAKLEAQCATLDEVATNLLMACEFQDLTGQRLNKVSNTLLAQEEQIGDLFATLGLTEGTDAGGLDTVTSDDQRPDTDLLHGPQDEGEGISQADIDALFD